MSTHPIIESDFKQIATQLNSLKHLLSGQTLAIAGGAGFLGRYLVGTVHYMNRNLLDRPCKVIVLDNFITGNEEALPDDEHIVLQKSDVSQPVELDEPVDYLIHAASLASPNFYNRYPMETLEVGYSGTKRMLELAHEKQVKSFLFLSSSEVYGDPTPENIPTTEAYLGNVSFTGPRACYDEAKRIGETLCFNYGRIHSVPVKIARPFNVFGPGIRLDDGRVVPTFVVSALRGLKLPIHGRGAKTRTFCYISDATVGLFKILLSECNLEVFNIGADDPEIHIRHLAETVIDLVENKDSSTNLVHVASGVYAESNPERRCPDLSKIRTELGYTPQVSLIAGLKRFIDWTRAELAQQAAYAQDATACHLCGSDDLRELLSLGPTPLANALLQPDALEESECLYPLDVVYCTQCHGCQLSHTVDPRALFSEYLYVTSTTETFRRHFSAYAESVSREFLPEPDSLVVDIGSNDGLLLGAFRKLGARVVGVEPAANIAKIARSQGIDTITDFFSEDVAEYITRFKGKARVITANNVFAHTKDAPGMLDASKLLLEKDGVLILEVQYLLDTMQHVTFDNIYHEHVSYFSVLSLLQLIQRQELDLFRVERVDSHGGSLRVFVQRENGPHESDGSVERFITEERAFGLDSFAAYDTYAKRVYTLREAIRGCIHDVKKEGKRIVGYGAPAKATTLLNFCKITGAEIDYIVDDNPLKQNLVVPGVRIPIRDSSEMNNNPPDFILVLAWNFQEEIIKKNAKLAEQGTKFIVPLPTPRIV